MREGLDTKTLRLLTIVGPIAYILALEVFSLVVLLPATGNNSVMRLLVIFGLLVIAAVPFSFGVFRVIDRRMEQVATISREVEQRNRELEAVNRAISEVSSALDLSQVLQTIADSARVLAHSRYAALGVADENGTVTQFITSGISAEQRAAIGPIPTGHGLIGALIRDRAPIRIPDIGADPRSYGFPPNHPPMTSLLGVPIIFNGRPVGDLYLTDKVGAPEFSPEDQDLVVLLARHAAVAIQNARLYEEVREARDRLQSWNRELEEKVRERTRQIQEYSRQLTTRVLQAQEDERKRIARELHDETAQSLSTLLINLDLVQGLVPPDVAPVVAGLDRVRTLARRVLDETRALSHDLRPTVLDDVGLAAALEWYAEEWTKTFGVPVAVEVEDIPTDCMPAGTDIALFRIGQESLNNCGKYADATAARVRLERENGSIKLVVQDNGRGFDAADLTGPSRESGLGLLGMRERVELLGGSLQIVSRPGAGTRIEVVAPLLAGTEGGTDE